MDSELPTASKICGCAGIWTVIGTCDMATVGAVARADANGHPAAIATPAPIAVRRIIAFIRCIFITVSWSLEG